MIRRTLTTHSTPAKKAKQQHILSGRLCSQAALKGGIFVEAKIRKLENNLVTIGTGIVILSLWTLFKTILYVIVYWSKVNSILSTLTPLTAAFVLGLVFAAILIEFVLHSFIGLSARSEGEGKKIHPIYLIITGIILVLYSALILIEFLLLFKVEYFSLTSVVSIVIDATSLAFLIDMIFSSVRLRKLRKQNA